MSDRFEFLKAQKDKIEVAQNERIAKEYLAMSEGKQEARDSALEQFTEYFVKNYPGPDTIIFKPQWHAPKIFRAAEAAIAARKANQPQEKAQPESTPYKMEPYYSRGFSDGSKAMAEKAAQRAENFGMSIHVGKKCLTGQAIAESIRSLASAEPPQEPK